MRPTAEPHNERQFGPLAVELGLLTRAQHEDALGIQSQLRELGVLPRPIPEICIEKGYLTREQVAGVEIRLRQKDEWPKIPGYEILDRLGRGGMGTVYKARQVSLDRTVAIKVLAPRLEGDEIFIGRFMTEAKAVARLNHKNVIAGIDVGEADGRHFFVMEYVDGETTSRRLSREGPLPEEDVISIGVQMAKALSHAAEHGLVHRDVKPQNIMITGRGVAKLCDLGLAKNEEGVTSTPASGRSVGTPYYISPEQAKGGEFADIRSDIYSLGATLFHLATGEPPFGGSSALVIMTKQMTEPTPSARAINPRVSRDLEQVLVRMMEKQKEDRQQSPDELLEDLRRLEGRVRVGAPSAGVRRRKAKRRAASRSSTPPGVIIAAIGVVLLVVFAIIMGGGAGRQSDRRASTWKPEADRALRGATEWIESNPEQAPAAKAHRLQRVIDSFPGTSAAERAEEAILRMQSGR
ncbi:MAG: serine/threonine-protein kinase [Planctomycetota bacterium]|nr:serine/threonine-protein kinase [Planctomycetota bacterium]